MTSLYNGPPDSGLCLTPKETIKLYPLHPCDEAERDEVERDIVDGLLSEVPALLEEVSRLGVPELIQVLAQNLTESPTISLPEITTEATELATPETEADLKETIRGIFGLSAEDSEIKLVLICKTAGNTPLPVGVLARTESSNVSAYVNCETLGRDSYLGRQIGEVLIRQVRAGSTGQVLFFDPNGAQANSEAVAIGAAWSSWIDGRQYERGVYELLMLRK